MLLKPFLVQIAGLKALPRKPQAGLPQVLEHVPDALARISVPRQPGPEALNVRGEVPPSSRTGRSIRSSLKGDGGNGERKVLHSGIQGTGCEDGGRINPITHNWLGGTGTGR